MPRIDLQVSYSEKNQVKQLGAKWDQEKKVWFIIPGVEVDLFKQWIPDTSHINIRASSFYIAKSTCHCWKCSGVTAVYAFLLPTGHETVEYDEETEVDFQRQWQRKDYPTILNYIDYLPENITKIIQNLTPLYQFDFSKTIQSSYWMNHCEHCGMKQGDHQLLCESSGPFIALNETEARNIQLSYFKTGFEAFCGGFSIDIDYFEHMPGYSKAELPTLLPQASHEVRWINASSIGAAKFCPQSVYLRKFGFNSLQDTPNMKKGKFAHRIASRDTRCFLATYIFSEQHWIVEDLREWRDKKLKFYKLGRILIQTYYYISPKLISKFGESILFRKFIRFIIVHFHRYFVKKES